MSEILSGWKDIANYMGKGVRTVQRYGRELGLPVRRISAKPKASVLVTREELDVWIHTAFNHQDSHEKPSVNLEDLKSRASELLATLEQLKQSLNKLATTREELALSRKTVSETAHRVHDNVFQTRVHPRNGTSRVA